MTSTVDNSLDEIEPKPMKPIMIKFVRDVQSARTRATLAEIQRWEVVAKARALSPESKAPSSRRMGYVRVKDGSRVEAIIARLKRLANVETAYLPAERTLFKR